MNPSSSPDDFPYTGYRILVADDNAINCHIAKRMLENLGCAVDLATSGQEVLEQHGRRSYDLILLDCQMPDMDGYQVCRTLRQLENTKRHIPVIGWTAHAHQEEISNCRAAGMDDCLPKQLRLDGLHRLLGAWLMPRSTMATAPHPSDLSGLEAMHRISGKGFAELVGLFETDMPGRLLDLKNAVKAPDHYQATRIAHMMSGCCASIGAMHLSDLCHELETQVRSCQPEDLLDRLAEIEAAYEQIRLTLHAMLENANKKA